MALFRSLMLLALVGTTLSEGVSPVQKVLQLLDELKGKVTSEVAAESAAMEEYMAATNENMRERGYAIKTGARTIADLQAKIEDCEATITGADADIESISTVIAAKELELKNATKTRKFQRIDFEFAEKKFLKEIDDVNAAIAEIEAGMSFLQGGKKSRMSPAQADNLRRVLDSLSTSGAILAGASGKRLRSLLQASAAAGVDESDELSFKAAVRQPQAKTENYASQSDGILEAVEATKTKAEASLEEIRKQELQDDHEAQMIEANLKDELKNLKGKLATSTAEKQASTEVLGMAQGDLSEAQAAKADDEKFSSTLRIESSAKSEEWEERIRSATGELGAIAKAVEILGGVTALVQSKAASHSLLRVHGDDRRLRVAQELRTLGRKFHNFALVELSTAAATDPFGKIRGLIEDMIAKLQAEAAEEASHKQFCDSEMSKSTGSQQEKEGKTATLKARMDEATASIASLTHAVKTLEQEVADIDKAQAEATKLRAEEKQENAAAAQTFKESADAVAAAIGALKAYYEGASLVQTRRQAAHQPSLGGASTDAGNQIIGVLEAAEEDFSQMLAETDADEKASEKAYADLSQANTVSRAEKTAAAKSKTNQINSLQVALSHSEEDHAAVSQELDAVLAYISKLKPECETKVMSYEEETAARAAEIDGLKQALSILTGKDMAALLQSEKRFLSRGEHV